MKDVLLGNKIVGDGNPCYTIAEIGILFKNFDEAKRLIDSAKEIGVDAVKFQTWEAETLTTKKNFFDMEVTGHASQYEFLKELEISKELQFKIVNYAKEKNVTIFSAPSHMKDLEVMEQMDLPIYKIGSDLACHVPLLKKIAKFGKPIILSTGMCYLQEIKNSVNAILDAGNDQLILLHCVSDYPSKIEESNLNAIIELKKEFQLPVGFSDHTIGTITSMAAAIIGANVIEKHFRDPQNQPSPDDLHALTKEEFKNLVDSIRIVEKAKGNGKKEPTKSEMKNRETNRVSIIAMDNISTGTIITEDLLDIRRPGTGIQPIDFNKIIGKKAKVDISREDPLTWEMIE